MDELIKELENEWESEQGFFGKLRMSGFDKQGFARVEALLKKVDSTADAYPRRLVSLVWFIPLFMSWQEVPNLSNEEYEDYSNRLENLVIETLGVP